MNLRSASAFGKATEITLAEFPLNYINIVIYVHLSVYIYMYFIYIYKKRVF